MAEIKMHLVPDRSGLTDSVLKCPSVQTSDFRGLKMNILLNEWAIIRDSDSGILYVLK